jgi:hypothetical protein
MKLQKKESLWLVIDWQTTLLISIKALAVRLLFQIKPILLKIQNISGNFSWNIQNRQIFSLSSVFLRTKTFEQNE